MKADSQQKVGDLYHLAGHAEVTYGEMRLVAERVDYNAASGELVATGDVRFTQAAQNENIQASRAEYNLRQGTGSFFEVQGSVGGLMRAGSSLLATTNPFYFTAERVDRLGENTYRVHNAEVTVCSIPDPTWTFSSPTATIRPGASVWIRHATLRLQKIPVFYFPVVYRSLRPLPRSTGFLMPTLGNNSRLGLVLGDSFFWAINRSADAEIGAEYLSNRGWSQQAGFRMRPSRNSYLKLSYFGVVDRGFGPQKVDQGGRSARAEGDAWFPGGFRGVLDFNYLSSLTFREAFAQTYAEAVNSEVHSSGFLTKSFDSFRLNFLLSHTENFQSLRPRDTVRLRSMPRAEFSSLDRPLWPNAPLWFSWDSSAGAVSRTEPAVEGESRFRTSLMERLEVYPRLMLPLRWKGIQLTPVLGYRATHYGNRRENGSIRSEPWQRGTPTLTLEWALPALSRLYSGGGPLYASPFRHVIEPRVEFRYVNGVGDFSNLLLFDEQDLVTNTTELEYSLTNRLLVKRPGGAGAQEVLSWEVRQQYYFDPTFDGALNSGRRNVFLSSLALSSNAFLDGPRRFSPIVSIVRFRPSARYEVEFREDYDTLRRRFVHGGLVGNLHYGQAFLSASHFFVRSSPALAAPSNQLGFTLGYGNLVRPGWNAAFAGAYDVRAGFLQFSAFQVSYNNDCCGISLEFRRFALGPARNENQFRVAFSLANVGTFGTLKKQERLF